VQLVVDSSPPPVSREARAAKDLAKGLVGTMVDAWDNMKRIWQNFGTQNAAKHFKQTLIMRRPHLMLLGGSGTPAAAKGGAEAAAVVVDANIKDEAKGAGITAEATTKATAQADSKEAAGVAVVSNEAATTTGDTTVGEGELVKGKDDETTKDEPTTGEETGKETSEGKRAGKDEGAAKVDETKDGDTNGADEATKVNEEDKINEGDTKVEGAFNDDQDASKEQVVAKDADTAKDEEGSKKEEESVVASEAASQANGRVQTAEQAEQQKVKALAKEFKKHMKVYEASMSHEGDACRQCKGCALNGGFRLHLALPKLCAFCRHPVADHRYVRPPKVSVKPIESEIKTRASVKVAPEGGSAPLAAK
jgi:hypothetical protein